MAAAFLFASIAFARSAEAGNKLWLAWDSSTTGCKQNTIDFFTCVLDDTNFNALALQYKYGESLTLGGTATLSQYCAPSDLPCVVSAAGFSPAAYDVVMHFYGGSWAGGTNGTATVVVNGKSITVNTAWVQSGNDCSGQTCSGAHEAFEAATDGVSCDCCNGQYGHASCSQCQPSCGQFDGNNGNPPWGCYPFTCNGTTYSMELIGSASNEFNAAGCTKLTPTSTCDGLHVTCTPAADGGSACCGGLTCEYFSESGKGPYSRACCKPLGAGCGANTDCCGGSNCNGGKCACVPEGQWCINANECCAGSTCDLNSYSCVANPPPDAGSPPDAGRERDAAQVVDANAAEASSPPDGDVGDSEDWTGSSGRGCSCTEAGSSPGSSGTAGALAALAAAVGLSIARSRRR
jgi:hypothetical protein